MQFTLKLNLDNDAFQSDNGQPDPEQLASTLNSLAQTLARYHSLEPSDRGTILDHNGNTVGSWSIQEG